MQRRTAEGRRTRLRKAFAVALPTEIGNITPRQMKTTGAIRKYAAEGKALEKGMEAKSKGFVESGAEVYTKA